MNTTIIFSDPSQILVLQNEVESFKEYFDSDYEIKEVIYEENFMSAKVIPESKHHYDWIIAVTGSIVNENQIIKIMKNHGLGHEIYSCECGIESRESLVNIENFSNGENVYKCYDCYNTNSYKQITK